MHRSKSETSGAPSAACAVGVNDQKRILATCEDDGDYDYELGTKDRCFLTLEDAQRFIEDEGAFTLFYGTTDLWPQDMPFRPGSVCCTADDDPGERENVFETNVCSVVFRGDGTVTVSDDMGCESCVVGPNLDTRNPELASNHESDQYSQLRADV